MEGKAWLHFKTITKHKVIVMKYCFQVGLYKQGLLHDLSKYYPIEFKVGAKYYLGNESPNNAERREKGYSSSWLHHKGRNKHHAEYWVDEAAPEKTPVIPYPYAVEMICDKIAAGMTYLGDKFTKEYELEYWNKERAKIKINEKTAQFITEVLTRVAKDGIDKTLTKKNMKEIYKKYCE